MMRATASSGVKHDTISDQISNVQIILHKALSYDGAAFLIPCNLSGFIL